MIAIAPETEKQNHILFFFILCAAAILRAYMAALDMNILLDQGLVQDDAFYYYVIARNIVEHGHSSFDGINLTNGYHPLWQAISLPVFYFFDGDTPVRMMLIIASIFDLLSLAIFYRILLRILKSNHVALIGVAILAFHGTIIRTWFNGLETALSIFSLLWLLHQFLTIKTSYSFSLKDHLWFGFIAAFSFLSRTDNAIIIVIIFAFLYLPPLITKKEFRSGIAASFIFMFLIAPWLAWNVIHFGSIVQISGQIRDNTWLMDGAPLELPILQKIIYGIANCITPVKIVFEKMFSPVFLKPISGFFYFSLFFIALIFAQIKYSDYRNKVYMCLPFIAGVIVLFLYHAGVRHFVRGWYNASVLLTFTLILCFLLDELKISFIPQLHRILLFFICAALITFYAPYHYTKTPKDLRLDNRLAAAEWINMKTPTDAIIGAANAGIMGYYTQRTVINLDGVVNENAFHARTTNQLQRYISDSGINYLADHKGSIALLCSANDYYDCVQVDNLGTSTQVMLIKD